MGFVGQVAVNRYVRAVGKQRLEGFVESGALRPGDLWRQIRVVRVDFHADGLCHTTHRLSNAPEADETQSLAGKFRALHGLLRPLAVAERTVGAGKVANGCQQMSEREFDNRLGAGPRCIDDRDASFPCRFEVDVVNPHAGPADDLQSVAGGLENIPRQFGCASNDDGVKCREGSFEQTRRFDVAEDDFMSGFFQPLDGLFIHAVRHRYSGHDAKNERKR